jgi:hypothetical protein
MCERCREINERVAHYQLSAARLTDRQALEGIQHIIGKLEQEKAALHPSRA